MNLSFSFIIPVYNRPNEIKELLDSLRLQTYDQPFEVVIVEDGSTISSEEVIGEYVDYLSISYYKKANSGPGDSRNYGMAKAKGSYFIVLDSDCILPPQYLKEAEKIAELFSIKGSLQIELLSSPSSLDTLNSLTKIKEIQITNGQLACHRYIISNCRGPLDVAKLVALFILSGWDSDALTIDIVPLFETIADLKNASKNIEVLVSFFKSSKSIFCTCFFFGMNPKKENLSDGNPDITTALTIEDGPGIKV